MTGLEGTVRKVSDRFASAKESLLLEHLKTELVFETSYAWAMSLIQEFLEANQISKCEIISLNDIVFCFGEIKMTGTVEGHKYKTTYSMPNAVFKKPLV